MNSVRDSRKIDFETSKFLMEYIIGKEFSVLPSVVRKETVKEIRKLYVLINELKRIEKEHMDIEQAKARLKR